MHLLVVHPRLLQPRLILLDKTGPTVHYWQTKDEPTLPKVAWSTFGEIQLAKSSLAQFSSSN